jgi:DNA-directed RNA polymerase subunit beta
VPEPGVPESFKVLIKELQSLGMDVKILSGNEEEIEMKEIDDEDDNAGDKLNLNLEGAEVGVE